jgi:hypothetical protein
LNALLHNERVIYSHNTLPTRSTSICSATSDALKKEDTDQHE